ncbi:MAG: ABC transporter substrate-binding protein [Desulfatirhabdiaceae bacterium]
MIKKMAIIIVSLAFLAIGTAGWAKDGIDAGKKLINLAGYDAATGKYGDYGQGNKKGQELAVEEINEKGGIQAGPLKGYKLKLTFFDDRGDPKESANVAKNVSSSDFLVALGPTMSSCALAATPVYFRNGVPNIITYANANTITEQGFDNIARLTYTTRSIAYEMATTVKERFKKDSVAIISENQDYGQQLLKGFKEKAGEIGIKVLSESVITPGQDIDFKSVLMKAKADNPGMLMIFVTYNEGGLLVKQVRQMGWDIPIYGPDGLIEPKFFELAGDMKETYILLSPTVDVKRPAAKVLVDRWTPKYGGFPPLAAIYGYDAVKVAAKVIEMGGVDRKSFIQNLKSVKVEGVGNPMYEFDKTGEGKRPSFVTLPAIEVKNQK